MTHECEHCGELFTARTKRARFCSGACREAARRRRASGLPERDATVVRLTTPESPAPSDVPDDPPSIYEQTWHELEAADRLLTPEGAIALRAAKLLDGGASGSAFNALHRSLAGAKTAVLAHASPKGGDVIDELAARRDRSS